MSDDRWNVLITGDAGASREVWVSTAELRRLLAWIERNVQGNVSTVGGR